MRLYGTILPSSVTGVSTVPTQRISPAVSCSTREASVTVHVSGVSILKVRPSPDIVEILVPGAIPTPAIKSHAKRPRILEISESVIERFHTLPFTGNVVRSLGVYVPAIFPISRLHSRMVVATSY